MTGSFRRPFDQFPDIGRHSNVIESVLLGNKTPASIASWTWIVACSFYPEGAHSELLQRSLGFSMRYFELASGRMSVERITDTRQGKKKCLTGEIRR